MFCRKCGANIPEDSQFCLKCGVTVTVPPVASTLPSGAAVAVATALERAPRETAPPADVLSPPQPKTNRDVSTQNGRRVLVVLGLVALVLWALRDLWQYGFFGTAFDPLLWLLGIPLYLLHRKFRSSAGKHLSRMERAEVVREAKPAKAAASRWARLGIFMGMALLSSIIGSFVFFKESSTTVEGLTKNFTKVSLQLGLAAWAVSEVVAGRWLTLKRTVIGAIALYGLAFILVAVFAGKPLVTKVEELTQEQAEVDRRFADSATGKALLQPQSFASQQVAAASLAEFQKYADATERLNKRKEALLVQQNDPPSFRVRMTAYLEATRLAAFATEELYRFAADPSQHVHVENGVVVIADPDGYNKRMDAVSNAMEKLRSATNALGESVPKETKEEK
jgi:zinc-ribbon domain